MHVKLAPVFALLLGLLPLASAVRAQDPSPSPAAEASPSPAEELPPELRGALSLEDQLKLRSAQLKAAEDPAVKAAIEKRNQAIMEFRAALREAVLKADPKVAPLLDKIGVDGQPGF